jgi:hypothetical protein
MFKKLPNSVIEPPGLERVILRKIPFHLTAATLVPILVAMWVHWFPPELAADALSSHLTYVKILAGAIVITAWTLAVAIGIACLIVIVMKGPTYVADSYKLSDSEQPRKKRKRGL